MRVERLRHGGVQRGVFGKPAGQVGIRNKQLPERHRVQVTTLDGVVCTLARKPLIADVYAAELLLQRRSKPIRPLVLASHQETNLALTEFARHIAKSLRRIRVTHPMHIRPRSKMHADPPRSPNLRDRIRSLKHQPRTLWDRSAVRIRAVI